MKILALGMLSAVALGVVLVGAAAPARAGGYDLDDYDGSTTVITRRTTIERRYVRPRTVVREIVVERPVIYRPRPIVREVVVERPVVYRPRRVFREDFVDRDGYDGPREFRRGPGEFGYGRPDFGGYD